MALTNVKTVKTMKDLEALFASSEVGRAESIELDLGSLGIPGLLSVLNTKHLARLRRLAIHFEEGVAPNAELARFAKVNGLPHLEALQIHFRHPKLRWVDQLLRSPLAQRLREIGVPAASFPPLDKLGMTTLPNLRHLALRDGEIPKQIVTTLETVAPTIESLDLTNGMLPPTTASHLGDPKQLVTLRYLDITGCKQWGPLPADLQAKHVEAMRARFGEQLVEGLPKKAPAKKTSAKKAPAKKAPAKKAPARKGVPPVTRLKPKKTR